MKFNGFPDEAFEFFDDLEMNNNREWFHANKVIYERACRGPMEALLGELEGEFGPSKIFRVNRDTRFSADKSPYKTNVAATVGRFYVSLHPEGLYAGGGAYMLDGPALARYREAVADDLTGKELEGIVATLETKGLEIGSHESLKSAPKGFSRDHPRVRFLRLKGIHAGRRFPLGPVVSSRKALDSVRKVFRDLKPLNDWLDAALEGVPAQPR